MVDRRRAKAERRFLLRRLPPTVPRPAKNRRRAPRAGTAATRPDRREERNGDLRGVAPPFDKTAPFR